MMRFFSLSAALLVLHFGTVSIAQESDQWQQLSHDDFVTQAARQLKTKKAKLGDIQVEAHRRLVAGDAAATAPYPALDRLTNWAAPQLSEAEKSALLGKLQSRKDQGTQLAFDDLEGRYGTLSRLSVALDAADKELLAWIDAHDLAALEVPQLEWLCFQLGQSDVQGDRLQIEWNGFLRPEQQGQYTFSPSRICTDRDWGRGRIRSAMKVMLDGAEIINTAKNGWHTESQPLLLDNTRDLPLKVTFAHERQRKELGQSCPGVAMLCWTGPGISHQLVPNSVLKPATGDGHGLNAEYKLSDVNLETRAVDVVATNARIDPQIDLCWWRSGDTGFRPLTSQRSKLVDALISRYGDAKYLETYRQQIDKRGKRDLDNWRQLVELSTLAQRQKFLNALLANPKFIESLPLSQARRLQQFLQPGLDEQALDIFPIWFAAQKEDPEPPFAAVPQTADGGLRALAQDAMMLPGAINYLRDHCVARPDGSCCLAAAYVAAYGSQWEGKLDDYCNWLDEHLGDLTLGGDRRAGWLIARSIAEGLRGNPSGHHYINNMQGWTWLEEAWEAAESEPAKLQVARHQATRLLDAGEKSQMQQVLKTAETQLTSAVSRAALADWRLQLGKLGIGAVVPQALSEKELIDYLAVLKSRAKSAESRGDAAALARYRALIAKLETK